MAGALRDQLLSAGFAASEVSPEADAAEAAPAEAAPAAPRLPPKVHLRYGRKAKGGRRATRIGGLTEGHAAWLKELCGALGVGGRVDEDELVLQGNQVDRAARFFEDKGVRRVVR